MARPCGTLAVLRGIQPALTAPRQRTAELAAQAGLPPERRPQLPRLTALRQAEQVQTRPLAALIRWQVDQVALIWSDLQAQPPFYHRLGMFPEGWWASQFRFAACGDRRPGFRNTI